MKDSVVIITGASSGIGAALAKQLAGKVSGMVLHARSSKAKLQAIATDLEAQGTKTELVLGDLAETGTATSLVTTALKRLGRLDMVVANAGFPILKSFDEGTPEDFDYAVKGNLASFFELAKASHPHLKGQPSASITAVGSFTSHVFRTDLRQFPMSAASKGALEVAVRSLAIAMAEDEIRVNCVVPGYIQKDANTGDGISEEEMRATQQRIPLGRPGLPAEVANTIRFLMSNEASYITGQSIHVNGGLI